MSLPLFGTPVATPGFMADVPRLLGSKSSAVLDLSFTQPNYLENGSAYALANLPGWSFTRASTKTALNSSGAVVSFASGVPAITDLGFLIEGASTNLFLQSGDASNAAWSKAQITPTANAIVGVLGTQTAAKLASSSTTSAAYFHQQSGTITSGATVTHWRVLKQAELNWVALTVFDASHHAAWFNLATGAVGTKQAGVTASIKALANGFYLCAVTYTTTGVTTAFGSLFITMADNTGVSSNVSIPIGSGVYQDIGQLEPNAAASSYIATTTGSLTRVADAPTLTYSGSPTTATVTYGSGSTATPSAASPLNLGASSGGAWVGNYVQRVVVQ